MPSPPCELGESRTAISASISFMMFGSARMVMLLVAGSVVTISCSLVPTSSPPPPPGCPCGRARFWPGCCGAPARALDAPPVGARAEKRSVMIDAIVCASW